MTDITKAIFNPKKRATAASGVLGGIQGHQGGRYGHLGASEGYLGASQEAFNPKNHFDVETHYRPQDHYDPAKLVKRY